MIQRQRSAFFALAVGLTLCALLAAAPVSGMAAATTATTVAFGGATTTKTKGFLLLRATLTDASGKPLSQRALDFYQQVELMGTRDSLVGSAETDTTGTATLTYQPAENGQQTIIARFAGDDTFSTSEGRGTIQVSTAQPPYTEEPQPLATPARWLPRIMGLLVAATWVVLFGVFLATAGGIRRAAGAAQAEA